MNQQGTIVRVRRGALVALALALLVTVAVGGGRGRAAAQEATPVAGAETSKVSVTGEGLVTITPDTATVTVGVDITQETLGEAQRLADEQMAEVIDALMAAGIAEADIQTTNYSVSVLRNYDESSGAQGETTGYQVSNQVNVKIRDIDQVGAILDTVVGEGANSIYGISFYVNDPNPALSQARELAVEDAKRKADELAAAAGMAVGRILTLSESSAGAPSPVAFAEDSAQRAGGAPIQVGSTEVRVDVQVTYELV